MADTNVTEASNGGASTDTKSTFQSDSRRNGHHQNQRGRGRGQSRGQGRGQGRGRGGQNQRNERQQKGEKGRGEWSRTTVDKRKRNDEEQAAKRQKADDGTAVGAPFTAEEISAEERKPKRKVAVMIGYAGSGYKGMQINSTEKTIEGDLFSAFVAAGAISKANADDPKKSSLVRCARTDKGVHAAGNMISLKLIIEDPDIVKKINEHLPAQIRVWGIERTNSSFSCYQTCDSRWYEYLIPTYSFLPPHPQSFLGKQLVESAEKEGVFESYQSRQEEVANFWKDAEEAYVKPILDQLHPEMRTAVMNAIHSSEEEDPLRVAQAMKTSNEEPTNSVANDGAATKSFNSNNITPSNGKEDDLEPSAKLGQSPLDLIVRDVKAAYLKAKKAYRISDVRRRRVEDTLALYLGTKNFHNYTIQKHFKDPSAKRLIRSFKVGTKPIIINDTEWLSLKVHGQSFMMHQIRKMVAMAALVVRCGSDSKIINNSYGPDRISIPKAPGLGLLLERPVFDSYNEKAVKEFEREKLDFGKFETEMEEFKQREIYERIFREEEKEHQFHTFFHHIDHYHSDYFLWVTASGVAATQQSSIKSEQAVEVDSEDEGGVRGDEEG